MASNRFCPKSHQQQTFPLRFIFTLIIITVTLFLFNGCNEIRDILSDRTQIEKFAAALQKAIEVFEEQKNETDEALKKANEARKKAMDQEIINHSSPQTKLFIEKWRDAESEVTALRTKFNDVIKSADFFFAYSEKKSRTIREKKLRYKMAEIIQKKKTAFTRQVKKSHAALAALEGAILRGNDIITSLEIVGGLKVINTKIEELGDIYDAAKQKLPETESLIKEGKKIFREELKGL